MNSIILLGALTTLVSSTGSVGMGDDIGFNGSGNYTNETVFRMTSSAFSEQEYRWYNDYNQLNINQWFNIEELYIDNSENYFAITQELYISTNNVDYDFVNVSSTVLIADMSLSPNNQNQYCDLLMSINSGDYFATCYDMIGKYFKIKTTFSYENIHTDTDLSWNTYENSQYNSITGLRISKYTASYEDTLREGFESGYNVGFTDGQNSMQDTITNLQNMYNSLNTRYQDLQRLYNNYINGNVTLDSLIWNIATTPFETFKTIWDVDILGVNLGSLCVGLMFVGIALYIWRKFI